MEANKVPENDEHDDRVTDSLINRVMYEQHVEQISYTKLITCIIINVL